MKERVSRGVERINDVLEKSDDISSMAAGIKKAEIRSDDIFSSYSHKLERAVSESGFSLSEADMSDGAKIENYACKKRQADISMLKTEKYILETYGQHIDQSRIEQLYDVLNNDKLTLYVNESFNDKYKTKDSVTGLREMQSGKISVKDSVYMDLIKKTSSHEAIHDISFHSESIEEENHGKIFGERDFESKNTVYKSGIHVLKCGYINLDGQNIQGVKEDKYRYLNEGLTEYYNIEAMTKRGEKLTFESYDIEKGLASAMRKLVGEEVVDRAYFGGDLQSLIDRFNSMSTLPDAWEQFNDCIDNYNKNCCYRQYDEAKKCVEKAQNILLGLEEPDEKVKVLRR